MHNYGNSSSGHFAAAEIKIKKSDISDFSKTKLQIPEMLAKYDFGLNFRNNVLQRINKRGDIPSEV